MLHAGMTNSSFALALVMRVLSLRYSPQYLDLEIWTPTRSYFAHTIVLSTRSRDWGQRIGPKLLCRGCVELGCFSDQTCGDIIDYIYLDQNKFLLDKTFED